MWHLGKMCMPERPENTLMRDWKREQMFLLWWERWDVRYKSIFNRFPQPDLLFLIFLVVLFLSVLFYVLLAATAICVLKFCSAVPFTILLTFLSCWGVKLWSTLYDNLRCMIFPRPNTMSIVRTTPEHWRLLTRSLLVSLHFCLLSSRRWNSCSAFKTGNKQ